MSTGTPEPDATQTFLTALADAAGKLRHVGHIALAQGAMGWAYRGDLANARAVLQQLPTDKLAEVSAAAAALSCLADEIGANR